MHSSGESKEEVLRPDFNHSILMDFQGAKLSSDTGFLLTRELDQRHNVISPMAYVLEPNIVGRKEDKMRSAFAETRNTAYFLPFTGHRGITSLSAASCGVSDPMLRINEIPPKN